MGDRDNLSARQVTRKGIPLEKANVHNGNKNADTDWLDTDLEVSSYIRAGVTIKPPALFRVQVVLPAAGKFTAMIDDDTTEITSHFNAGGNLVADSLYIFDMLVHDGDKVNFQSDQNQNGFLLRVQEIGIGVQ